jgi:hypothetical protein
VPIVRAVDVFLAVHVEGMPQQVNGGSVQGNNQSKVGQGCTLRIKRCPMLETVHGSAALHACSPSAGPGRVCMLAGLPRPAGSWRTPHCAAAQGASLHGIRR